MDAIKSTTEVGVSNVEAVVEESIVKRITKAPVLFDQNKTACAGVKNSFKIFGKKAKRFDSSIFPESRNGHLFLSVADLYSSSYEMAINKVVALLKGKGYSVKFPAGLKIERKVDCTASESFQIRAVDPLKDESILAFNEKSAENFRLLGLLELLYFVLIEELVSEDAKWVICPGDVDLSVTSKHEHVPLVKIHKKEIMVIPTIAKDSYKYPFGVLVEVEVPAKA